MLKNYDPFISLIYFNRDSESGERKREREREGGERGYEREKEKEIDRDKEKERVRVGHVRVTGSPTSIIYNYYFD